MKKIVCLANSILNPKARSGGDVIFIELCKRFNDIYTITVITSNSGYKQWSESIKDNVQIQYIVLSSRFYEKYLNKFFISVTYSLRALEAFYLLKKIKFRNNDIVYSSSDFICDTFPIALFKLIHGNKITWVSRIYHVIPPPNKRQGSLVLNTLSYFAQRLSFFLIRNYSDTIISLNSALSEELKSMNFPPEKIRISGAGIDFKLIDSVSPSKNEYIYDGIFFGRIAPQKGIYDLIRIWIKVVENKKNAKLAIIGGGALDEVHKLKNEINVYNLKNNIDYLGYIPSVENIYGIMKSCKLYLFTDHENGWGISVAEGMACKLPVVAYNLEIFGSVHKKGFITVLLKDVNQFSKAVLHLLNNETERQKLSLDAYEQAKDYDWDNVTKGFIKILEETRLSDGAKV